MFGHFLSLGQFQSVVLYFNFVTGVSEKHISMRTDPAEVQVWVLLTVQVCPGPCTWLHPLCFLFTSRPITSSSSCQQLTLLRSVAQEVWSKTRSILHTLIWTRTWNLTTALWMFGGNHMLIIRPDPRRPAAAHSCCCSVLTIRSFSCVRLQQLDPHQSTSVHISPCQSTICTVWPHRETSSDKTF